MSRHPLRRALALGVFGAMVASAPRSAYAFFPERYLTCRAVEAEREAPPPRKAQPDVPEDDLEPLPRVSPRALPSAPLIVADVATREPTPSGHRAAVPSEEPAPRVAVAGPRNDFRCLGIERGARGVVRVIGTHPRARFRDHPFGDSWIGDNLDAAAWFRVEGARDAARAAFRRPIPEAIEAWEVGSRLRLKVKAAMTLAELGDSASAEAIRDFAASREREDYPLLWEDTVRALELLDPARFRTYAIEALTRVADAPDHGTAEQNRVLFLAPKLRDAGERAAAPLAKLSARLDPNGSGGGFESCQVYAARLRVAGAGSEAKLLASMRAALGQDLRTNREVVCYTQLIEAAFPGKSPDEVDVLLFRHRYRELIRLVTAMDAADRAQAPLPGAAAARSKIKAWLGQRASEPDIKLDKTDRRYNDQDRARHLALAAALGDAAAGRDLERAIRDPADESVAPWIGANAALDLGLSFGRAAAEERLRLSIAHPLFDRRSELYETRGKVTVIYPVEVMDRLRALGDSGYALGLLSREVYAREAGLHAIARAKPSEHAAICKVVADAAAGAEEKSVEDAFWALSSLGGACRGEMARLFADTKQPDAVRGMALEALAMRRDAVVGPEVRGERRAPFRAARERAAIILSDPTE